MNRKTTTPDVESRVEELRGEIRRHDYLYYVRNAPEISDEAYDRLFRELVELEEAHPELRAPDSPTQRVGAAPLDEFPTVAHAAPMLSLDSDVSESALRRFDERMRKAASAAEQAERADGEGGPDVVEAAESGEDVSEPAPRSPLYVVEPKLDGTSVELVYEEGRLVRAATRGDGVRGEGVTENVRTIPSVPLRLREDGRPAPPLLSVRAEVIMRIAGFEELNERLVERGETPFANPRNAAAGSLRQLDPRVTAQRPLEVYVFDILAGNPGIPTQWETLRALRDWGLRVNELEKRADAVEEILEFHAGLEAERDDLPYEIDGVVVKLDDLALREKLGATSRHPRWAFALKFHPRKEVTRVLRIVPSVGRTGVVTPIAFLRPVDIGGVTVSRASLHNREQVRRLDVREGDRVRVQRAGDVIPQVVERIEEEGRERAEEWAMPDRCPSCGTELVERGPYTLCPASFACQAQLAGRLRHFGSRAALDIEGLGEETARLLVRTGLVRRLPDLFLLRPEQLEALEGFAEVSARKLVAAIHESARDLELERFIYGLGIPEVGTAVARDLARHFGSLESLREAGDEQLQEVGGVGPKMAEQIAGFFRDPANRQLLDALLEHVSLKAPERGPEAPGEPGALDGLAFVFTGELERWPRREAEALVERHGGRAVSSMSGRTDYLVAGPGAGSKLERARELEVEVLDEAGFLALLEARGVEPDVEGEA